VKARFEKMKAPVFFFALGMLTGRYFDFTQLTADVSTLLGGIFS